VDPPTRGLLFFSTGEEEVLGRRDPVRILFSGAFDTGVDEEEEE
jgi:hypothetical protein